MNLDAIMARADAATEPTDGTRWITEKHNSNEVYSGPLSANSEDIASWIFHDGDAEFIAHAREDVPALVAEVRVLRDQRDTAREMLAEVGLAAEFDKRTGGKQ